MKQNKENTNRIDVDKAWDNLYLRLEEDRLLIEETDYSSRRKRIIPFRWAAIAAAAVFAGFIFYIFYSPQKNDNSFVFLQNKDNSGALVITLEDSSIVYLASNASIFYPTVFEKNKRKVELNGNALFCVTKDEKRPFVIETKENVTIEVVGTIFAVQSSSENSFELSVKEGKVNVHSKVDKNVVPVEAGETVQLKTTGLSKYETVDFRVFNYFTEKMCFKDEKLNNIVHAINKMYGYPAVITDKSLNNRTLTVTFEDDSVENMTELICVALNLKQVNKQDTIFIR